jgi:hypothetical protein
MSLSDTATIHPFVALMKTYCIDYTNSHDQSLYDEIMEPDYVVHISGYDLVRDESYSPAVTDLFRRAPGLGLVVHELVLNGDKLCLRFSEHAAMPSDEGRRLGCWKGIGVYSWNGRRLTENFVEQDYYALNQQVTSGHPHPLEPPHLDPWVSTEAVAADPSAEAAAHAWITHGDLADAGHYDIDDSRTGRAYVPIVEWTDVTINDLFSAGPRVAFHATVRGPYRGGLEDVPDTHLGTDVTLHAAGLLGVASDGSMESVHAVTTRMGVRAQLTGASPI